MLGDLEMVISDILNVIDVLGCDSWLDIPLVFKLELLLLAARDQVTAIPTIRLVLIRVSCACGGTMNPSSLGF